MGFGGIPSLEFYPKNTKPENPKIPGKSLIGIEFSDVLFFVILRFKNRYIFPESFGFSGIPKKPDLENISSASQLQLTDLHW